MQQFLYTRICEVSQLEADGHAGVTAKRRRRVLTILDLNASFAKLKILRGRTPETTAAQREGAFARLVPYRDGAIFAAKFAGEGAWGRHLQGAEIVQLVDGTSRVRAAVLRARCGDGGDRSARGGAPVRGAGQGEPDDRDASADRASRRRHR